MVWILVSLVVLVSAYFFWPDAKLTEGAKIDRIEVFKSKRKMRVYSGDVLRKTYSVALGKNPVGHKRFEGDFKTPEGTYAINDRNPNSAYYKNLGISYPNETDVSFAASRDKSAGGAIKIHGLRNGRGFIGKFHRWNNWTAGCIAVTNSEMDELYVSVEPNALIEINP